MKFRIILFSIWIVIWLNFIARDFYKEKQFDEYRLLATPFYEFLKFAKNNTPDGSSYDFVGIEDFSLDSRRGIYYLYPSLKKQDADYLLVYDMRGFRRARFLLHAELDKKRFILKKTK